MIAQIEKGAISEKIERTVHDFFTPQPVKGARAYFMHSILHDWPDDRCRDILVNLKGAMEKNHSKILIFENVIPDFGASWKATGVDFFMMASFASRERAKRQWRDLLGSVGMKIVGIWTKDQAAESLIEAVLEDDETPNV